MSNWYRIPRPVSIGTLLFRMKRDVILDDGMSQDLPRYLPDGTHRLREFGDPKRLCHKDVVHICQQKHGILVTTDVEYALLLNADSKDPWGSSYFRTTEPCSSIFCGVSQPESLSSGPPGNARACSNTHGITDSCSISVTTRRRSPCIAVVAGWVNPIKTDSFGRWRQVSA